MQYGIWCIVGWLFCTALWPTLAAAESRHCDRQKRYESLSQQAQGTLQGGAFVLEVDRHTGSDYHVGYVYKLVSHAPELIMAVFTTYPEQKEYISGVLEATVEEQRGNYARVRFLYDLPWPIPDSEYVVNDTVMQDGETYLLYWNLHPSSPSGLSAPKYVEGYFRTQPTGSGTLIIYCNYVIPGLGLMPDKVNRNGLQAMRTTMHDTVQWVEAIAATSTQSTSRLLRFRQMLGGDGIKGHAAGVPCAGNPWRAANAACEPER
jgi:hypothetical protein